MGDALVQWLTATFHQTVGIEQQGCACRYGHLGLRAEPVDFYPQRYGVPVVEHPGGAFGVDQNRRWVPGIGVNQLTG